MELEINVTQADIDCAGGGGKECPISQAANRIYPHSSKAFTTHTSVYVNNRGYALPTEAQHFLGDFDKRRLVKPITFVARQFVSSWYAED